MCRTNNTKNKKLNSLDILMVSFGAMIGWGWVISSGLWIKQAGILGTMIGFVIGGIMIYFIGLIYAELTTSLPKGGCMIFSYKAFGSTMSFICTWIMIFSYIGVVCFEACSLPTIIAYIFPNFLQGYLYTVAGFDIYLTWLLVAICFTLLIMFVNIIGIKTAAIFQNILTIIIALVGIILIGMSIIKGNINNLQGQIIHGEDFGHQIKNILVIATVAPFFLFGFDVIPQAVSDINVDLKKTGKILVLSIVLSVLFYALVVLAIGFALNPNELNDSVNNSGLTAADAMKKLLNSDAMVKVLILGGLCGIITSWNSFLIGGSRTISSLANLHMIPVIFAKKHKKFDTPVYSIILVSLLSIISLFFGRNMLIWITNVSSFASCLAYCIVSISYLIIRKKYSNIERPYKVKNWKFIGVMGVFMSLFLVLMFLIPNMGNTFSIYEITILSIWVILGILFYMISKIKYKNRFGQIDDERGY